MKIVTHLIKLPLLVLFLFVNQDFYSQTLKEIAISKGKFIGNIMSDAFINNPTIEGGELDNITKTEYNVVVTENAMKMDNLLRNRPVNPFNVQVSDINTAVIDKFIGYADANGLRKRGHVLIWFSQIPSWLQTEYPTWNAQQVYDFSRTYILALSKYTAGKIDEWDVLNEALVDNGYRKSTWYDIVNTQANNDGKIGYIEYFASLYKWAHEGDPNAILFYNDYAIEAFGSSKNNFMREMVKNLKNIYNAPIVGVGLQSHFSVKELTPSFIDNVGKTIDDLAQSGFIVNLTELDIRLCNGDNKTLEDQKTVYKNLVTKVLSKKNCNTVLIWGVSDKNSWINSFFTGCGQATPHDLLFQKKTSIFWDSRVSKFPNSFRKY